MLTCVNTLVGFQMGTFRVDLYATCFSSKFEDAPWKEKQKEKVNIKLVMKVKMSIVEIMITKNAWVKVEKN